MWLTGHSFADMKKKPVPKKGKSLDETLKEDARWMRNLYPEPPVVNKGRWARYRILLERFFQAVHRKGTQKLTIMVIPHTEKKIFNLHINFYSLSISGVILVLVVIISVVSLVGKSGESIEFYDMGLTNSQFNIQSTKIADEILPLHELINEYTNAIAELYVKIDGKRDDVAGQGGVAQAVIDREISDLKEAVVQCRALGDACNQQMTDEILKRVIYLSSQDNMSLKRAVELSDRVITELKTKEKQNLIKNTPSIWPVRGYVLHPYGWQVDPLRGHEIFLQGVELGALPGSEVYAAAPGTVSDISYDSRYGLNIWVTHKFGIRTFYAHLDRVSVAVGDRLSKGEVVGYVGKSGNAPVSMLYYEVHVGTVAYTPHAFLNHIQDQWLIKPNH